MSYSQNSFELYFTVTLARKSTGVLIFQKQNNQTKKPQQNPCLFIKISMDLITLELLNPAKLLCITIILKDYSSIIDLLQMGCEDTEVCPCHQY